MSWKSSFISVIQLKLWTESWEEGKSVEEKDAKPTESTADLWVLSSKTIQEFGWTSQGMDWGWDQGFKSHHTQINADELKATVKETRASIPPQQCHKLRKKILYGFRSGEFDALNPASVHSLWSSPKFLNIFCLTILIRLRFFRLVVHLFLPHFFLPLNFLLTCLDTALCEQPASLAMNVCGLSSLWRVSMIVFWTTVRSAVFPMIV